MADDKKDKGETAKPKQNPAQIKKMLMIAFAAVNLLAMGVGLLSIYSTTVGEEIQVVTEEQEEKNMHEAAEKRDEIPPIYTLPKLIVNLDGLPKRLLRTEISVEMLDEEGFEEVVSLGAQARDAILRLLSSKRYDELNTVQGKLFLKDQVATTLNRSMKKGVVKDIYFSEFIMQ